VSAQRGFTLIEVMVALVVTGMVVSLAYGTLRAGLDARERLDDRRARAESLVALRAVLGDALRHVERGVADDDTVPAMSAAGAALLLATRGLAPPQGAGERWRLTLAATTEGVRLDAAPERAGGVPVRLLVHEARALEVRVLPYAGAAWSRGWTRPSAAPAAVAVRLLDGDGRDLAPPLIARTRPAGEAELAP
jgi:general secretion pathway protein J